MARNELRTATGLLLVMSMAAACGDSASTTTAIPTSSTEATTGEAVTTTSGERPATTTTSSPPGFGLGPLEAGMHRTRLFNAGFAMELPDGFVGMEPETTYYVLMAYADGADSVGAPRLEFYVFAPHPPAEAMAAIEAEERISDLAIEEITLDGRPGMRAVFDMHSVHIVAGLADPTGRLGYNHRGVWRPDHAPIRVQADVVDLGSGMLFVIASAHPDDFDRFLVEVVTPTLQTLRFE